MTVHSSDGRPRPARQSWYLGTVLRSGLLTRGVQWVDMAWTFSKYVPPPGSINARRDYADLGARHGEVGVTRDGLQRRLVVQPNITTTPREPLCHLWIRSAPDHNQARDIGDASKGVELRISFTWLW